MVPKNLQKNYQQAQTHLQGQNNNYMEQGSTEKGTGERRWICTVKIRFQIRRDEIG